MNIQTEYVSTAGLWCAIDEDTYDGAEDAGYQPHGWAKSRLMAIALLLKDMKKTSEEAAEELIGRGFTDWQVAQVMNTPFGEMQ